MQKFSTLLSGILVIAILILTGCKKDTSSSQPSGNLFGFVTLNDQYGAKVLSGANNTTVTLTTSAGNTLNTTPDSTGRYTFNNINQGQYLISFVNPGYGVIQNAQLGFLGGGNVDHDVKLSAIPNFTDSLLQAPIDTLGNIILQGTFSGNDTRKRTYVIFVGSTPSVSSAPANYLTYYSGNANNNLTTFTQKISVSDLNDLGFTSGSTVYFSVYGAAANFATSSDVEDYAHTGRLMFNSLSANASTTSILLP